MLYAKLVRDKIPDIIRQEGREDPVITTLTEEEARLALYKKLVEEVGELIESGETGEMADVLEVVYGIAALQGLSEEELDALRREKAEKRGGFRQRIFLVKTNERRLDAI